MAWGGWGPGPPATRFVMAAGGLLVAVSGFAGRVGTVEVNADALWVRHAARRPFALSWSEVRMLRAPRWPLGGWCVIGARGRRTLMPSDLLGHEWVLGAVIDRAGLRFVGGEWTRARREIPVSRAG